MKAGYNLAQGQSTDYGAQTFATAPQAAAPVESPLTVAVMDGMNRAQEIANEVRSRLYLLRERLIGSPPENGSLQGSSPTPPASCFRHEHQDRSLTLLATLNIIDQISAELAGRL